MKAIQLTGYKGFESMQLFEVEKPKPAANEVLLEVKAAGVSFAELALTKGRYRIPKEPPFIMGFEAAGVVVELGARVKNLCDCRCNCRDPDSRGNLLQRGGHHSGSRSVGICASQAGGEASGLRNSSRPICSRRCRPLFGAASKNHGR